MFPAPLTSFHIHFQPSGSTLSDRIGISCFCQGFLSGAPNHVRCQQAYIRGSQWLLWDRNWKFCKHCKSFHSFCNKYFPLIPFLSSQRILPTLLKTIARFQTRCGRNEKYPSWKKGRFSRDRFFDLAENLPFFRFIIHGRTGRYSFKQCGKRALSWQKRIEVKIFITEKIKTFAMFTKFRTWPSDWPWSDLQRILAGSRKCAPPYN